jgi:hypothetical protein
MPRLLDALTGWAQCANAGTPNERKLLNCPLRSQTWVGSFLCFCLSLDPSVRRAFESVVLGK